VRAQQGRLTTAHCVLLHLDTSAALIKERSDALFLLADLMRARQAK
jgi:hypothetical protein